MPEEEFKKGDKFIITLGEPDPGLHMWWAIYGVDYHLPESFLSNLPRYVETTERREIPALVREALERRADDILKEIGERVKDLEEERDAIMDFLNGKVGEKK